MVDGQEQGGKGLGYDNYSWSNESRLVHAHELIWQIDWGGPWLRLGKNFLSRSKGW